MPAQTTPKVSARPGRDGKTEVTATSPTETTPVPTTASAAPKPLSVKVENFPDGPDPGWTILGALVVAIIGAYIGQRLAHRYALQRQHDDRQDARRDSRHDDGRKTVTAALEVMAAEKKRLGELQQTALTRRQFFKDELTDHLVVDKDRLAQGRTAYYEDQQKSIDTGRVVEALRPGLALHFDEDGPLLKAFDTLAKRWKDEAHNMLAVDEKQTTKETMEAVGEAFAAVSTAIDDFGKAAVAEVSKHVPPSSPSAPKHRRRPGRRQ